MKSRLIVLLIALMAMVNIAFAAPTTQEILLDQYLPRDPIMDHTTKAVTDVVSVYYTGTGTAPTASFATPTFGIYSSAAAYSFDTSSSSYDTPQELIAAINAKSGWVAALGDQFKGTESFITHILVDVATATAVATSPATFDLTTSFNYGSKLYMASKTPAVFRILWTNTYSGGTSILHIYRGTSADSNTADTEIAQWTSAATTVEKEVDLTPYQVQGLQGGYLKFFVENSTNQSAGVLTILGSYK